MNLKNAASLAGDIALVAIALLVVGPQVWARLSSDGRAIETRDVNDFAAMLSLSREGAARTDALQIVMFTDHECAACFDAYQLLGDLAKQHGARVRVLTAYFPLPQHMNAARAATASVCAMGLTSAVDLEEALYSLRNRWTDSSIHEVARKVPTEDRAAFLACATQPDTHPVVSRSRLIARDEAFAGTPAIIIDGKLLVGEVNSSTLGDYVAQALSQERRQ